MHLLTLFLFWLLELILKWVAVVGCCCFVCCCSCCCCRGILCYVVALSKCYSNYVYISKISSFDSLQCRVPKNAESGWRGGTNETCVSTTNRPNRYRYIYGIYDTYMIVCMAQTHTHTHRNKDLTHTLTRIRLMAHGKWNVIYIEIFMHNDLGWASLGYTT